MKKLILPIFLILGITMFLGAVSALCTDTDGGKNIYQNGEIHFISPYAQDYDTGMYTYDSCSNGILYERYCGVNGSTIETEEMSCPTGYKCEIDKCIKNDEEYTPDIEGDGNGTSSSPGGGGGQGGGCYDTDGGKDIYKKGIAAGIYDSCISKYQLSERYCTNSQGADYIVDCPISSLCSNGACVQNDEDDREQTNITPSTGGGGSGSGTSNTTTPRCEKYYNCSDGSQVQYCFIHKFYNENGEVTGAGCGCKSNPQILCTSPSSGGGGGSGGQPIIINSSSGGGGGGGSVGSNETPIICNGCILGNKCAPVGYRQEGKYCTINSEFVSQLNADASCDNNFECSTNLCIDNNCVSSNLWQKFVRWFSRLFGGK